MELVALIPAHDEGAHIARTLDSLRRQVRRPDRVIVISDNSTDDTVAAARRAGAEVWETRDNTAMKAGALNQALDRLLPALADGDAVLVMDADSVVSTAFLSTARALLEGDGALGAVGGVFHGTTGGGLLGQLQRNEYLRYGRDIARHPARVMVLTGTASVIRVSALRQVAAERGRGLPGTPGRVYDTLALTEDNELTLALKTLGWRLASPPRCRVTTEIMPSWSDLWRQRLRWQRGAVENLRHYGLTRTTARYWLQQAGIGFGVVALSSYFLLCALTLVYGQWSWNPFWLGIGVLFMVERVVTAWAGGTRARLLAAVLLVELVYDAVIQAVYVRALLDMAAGRAAGWHHPGQRDAA
ncbi:glycosyltransferase [Streptomyces sp. NPDC004126]|uniref:glycosyltransferase n=1 Tax=Streptomyces sp. NPDC004126 TaxID=3390695 RepID=UPI003D086E27